ncbi:MAG: dynein regulation protein LC7 [candidate division NC10 bacterium RIFCSPLOWO2_12_FULL_66_18]|nr:MAG: dynein regulation protein LC7 [candidate division NC10 bacterium RIFCSPLOWO2_02_FULL_66_22]OGC00866.1 MAG: dynein regulation protein LC7 [candidate division NC10 bacterium RIFCSPLOWO2_12_FULL_66_18]
MLGADLTLYEEDERRLAAVLRRLCEDAKSRAVFLIDKSGQLIAAAGETANVDTTSLASLTAGNIAASGGLAQLLGEKEFSVLFHEGEKDNLHISVVAQRAILVVLFDHRSSLGLVRLRLKRAAEDIGQAFAEMALRTQQEAGRGRAAFRAQFAQLTDEDIENLFKG